MSAYALFINGVFRDVLEEILEALAREPDRIYYLQPHSGSPIGGLQKDPPSESLRVPLYMSTSDDLKSVGYKAEIVGWEDKRHLGEVRRKELTDALDRYQPDEGGLVNKASDGGVSVNLISILEFERLAEPFGVDKLIKKSDGRPLSTNRSRPGGYAYVWPPEGV